MKRILILIGILLLSGIYFQVNAEPITAEAMLEYNQGIDYYKSGQYDQAITAFREAIKIDPDYIDAYYNLGAVLEYLQQYDAALVVFNQIIVRKPEDYDSVYKAAWISYKLGEYQKAKTYLGILPENCARTKDAEELLRKINLDAPCAKPNYVRPKSYIPQTNAVYSAIPAPTGITTDKLGNLYVAEYNNNSIIKITPNNKKVLYAKSTMISGPIGIAYDNENNLYIANYNKNNVLKVSELGDIKVLISNIKKPYYLYISGNILFISCQGSNSILRFKLK